MLFRSARVDPNHGRAEVERVVERVARLLRRRGVALPWPHADGPQVGEVRRLPRLAIERMRPHEHRGLTQRRVVADGGHRHHGHGGGGYSRTDWFGPMIGGMIIGGIVGGALSNQPRYDDENYFHTECRREQVFDRWGNFLGVERRCYRVPNQ